MNKLNENQYRQGDVLVIRTDAIAKNLTNTTPKEGRVVLHHGEAAHHFHAFYDKDARNVQTFVRKDGDKRRPEYLKVVETAYLRHEEHSPATLPPGIYKMPVQVEMTDENDPIVVAD